MVGVTGFEPTTFWSRTKRATKLRYTPNALLSIYKNTRFVKQKMRFYCFAPQSFLSIASAASLPAPMAKITVAAPVTASPPA